MTAAQRTRTTDPITSFEAADSNNVSDSEAVVLIILREMGPLADHELVEEFTAGGYGFPNGRTYTPQRLRSARAHLVEIGEVEQSTEFRLTPTGRRAHVWQIAEPQPEFTFDTLAEWQDAQAGDDR